MKKLPKNYFLTEVFGVNNENTECYKLLRKETLDLLIDTNLLIDCDTVDEAIDISIEHIKLLGKHILYDTLIVKKITLINERSLLQIEQSRKIKLYKVELIDCESSHKLKYSTQVENLFIYEVELGRGLTESIIQNQKNKNSEIYGENSVIIVYNDYVNSCGLCGGIVDLIYSNKSIEKKYTLGEEYIEGTLHKGGRYKKTKLFVHLDDNNHNI